MELDAKADPKTHLQLCLHLGSPHCMQYFSAAVTLGPPPTPLAMNLGCILTAAHPPYGGPTGPAAWSHHPRRLAGRQREGHNRDARGDSQDTQGRRGGGRWKTRGAVEHFNTFFMSCAQKPLVAAGLPTSLMHPASACSLPLLLADGMASNCFPCSHVCHCCMLHDSFVIDWLHECAGCKVVLHDRVLCRLTTIHADSNRGASIGCNTRSTTATISTSRSSRVPQR